MNHDEIRVPVCVCVCVCASEHSHTPTHKETNVHIRNRPEESSIYIAEAFTLTVLYCIFQVM